MEAGIADFEGYGAHTLLTELIAQKYGGCRENFRDAVFQIYASTEHSPASQVASCAGLVSEAARQGDLCAKDILEKAGRSLGIQMTALISKYHLPDELPLTISGSVWRSERILFDSFAACIKEQCADRPIVIPPFEPIIGLIIRHYQKLTGTYTEQDRERFEKWYGQFRFSLA